MLSDHIDRFVLRRLFLKYLWLAAAAGVLFLIWYVTDKALKADELSDFSFLVVLVCLGLLWLCNQILSFAYNTESFRVVPDSLILELAEAEDISMEVKQEIALFLQNYRTIRFSRLLLIQKASEPPVHANRPPPVPKVRPGYQRMIALLQPKDS